VGNVHCFECVALYNQLITVVGVCNQTVEDAFKLYTIESQKLISQNWSNTARLLVKNPQLKYCHHCYDTRVVVVTQAFLNNYDQDVFQIEFHDTESESESSSVLTTLANSAENTEFNRL